MAKFPDLYVPLTWPEFIKFVPIFIPVVRGEHECPDGILFSRIWRGFPGVFGRQRSAILGSFDLYYLSSLCYLDRTHLENGSTLYHVTLAITLLMCTLKWVCRLEIQCH